MNDLYIVVPPICCKCIYAGKYIIKNGEIKGIKCSKHETGTSLRMICTDYVRDAWL